MRRLQSCFKRLQHFGRTLFDVPNSVAFALGLSNLSRLTVGSPSFALAWEFATNRFQNSLNLLDKCCSKSICIGKVVALLFHTLNQLRHCFSVVLYAYKGWVAKVCNSTNNPTDNIPRVGTHRYLYEVFRSG